MKTRFACSLTDVVVYKPKPSSKTGSFSSSVHNACRARPRLKFIFSRERAWLRGDQIGLDKFCS